MKRVLLRCSLAHGIFMFPSGYGFTDLFGAYQINRSYDWTLLHLPSGKQITSAQSLHDARRIAIELTFDFRDIFTGIKTLTGFRRKVKALSPERLARLRELVPPLRSVG